ncbi:hypothetical protein [uncultured Caballeronia sp.]|jgi:hypothetical protein|uniref:hypothetical protein n=1 Tax=uncultured Caballeronia sp. TaxID=1827198 RepID=UPI001575360F
MSGRWQDFDITLTGILLNKKVLKLAAISAVLLTGLSACGTTQMNMIEVQKTTSRTIGLASSDEITVSNIKYGQRNSLGGTPVTYDATTTKGRRFGCSVFMIPGLTPLDKPAYNDWECHPR